MNKKNILRLILYMFLLIVFLVIFQTNKYGTRYNDTRIRLGIPVLSNHWHRNYSFLRSEINYVNQVTGREKRYHLKKRIQTDWLMNIEKESDYFVIEDKDIVIDARYNYQNSDHWYIWYYHKRDSLEKSLSYSQFIDTLKKYDMDIRN